MKVQGIYCNVLSLSVMILSRYSRVLRCSLFYEVPETKTKHYINVLIVFNNTFTGIMNIYNSYATKL